MAVNNEPQNDGDAQARGRRRQRTKNWALFAALVSFVVVIYLVSIVKMSGG